MKGGNVVILKLFIWEISDVISKSTTNYAASSETIGRDKYIMLMGKYSLLSHVFYFTHTSLIFWAGIMYIRRVKLILFIGIQKDSGDWLWQILPADSRTAEPFTEPSGGYALMHIISTL